MDIDEPKVVAARADRRLEKPFDAEHLRSIVTELVPKTKTNPVSSFLNFPEMPEFEETPTEQMPAPISIPSLQKNPAPRSESMNLQSLQKAAAELEEINVIDDPDIFDIPGEEFSAVPLTTPRMADEAEDGEWAHQDLTKFKIQLPESESEDFAAKFVIPQDEDLSSVQVETEGEFEEISFVTPASKAPPASKPPVGVDSFISKVERSVKEQMKDQMMATLQKRPTPPPPPPPEVTSPSLISNAQPKTQSKIDLNSDMMEKLIREEARELIQSVCWKVIPEIAERVIREELHKILRETEKSI